MVGTAGSILESPRRRLRPVSSLRAIHDRIREADGINRCRCFSKKHRPGPCFDNAGRDHFGNGYAERSSLRRSERQFAAVGKCLFQEFQYQRRLPCNPAGQQHGLFHWRVFRLLYISKNSNDRQQRELEPIRIFGQGGVGFHFLRGANFLRSITPLSRRRRLHRQRTACSSHEHLFFVLFFTPYVQFVCNDRVA